jgi:hypothetical protein
VAVTGVTDALCPRIKVTDACTSVVTISGGGGSGLTVSEKLLELVWLTESVTVTVYSVSMRSSVGVPPSVPLAVLKVNPADKTGDML